MHMQSHDLSSLLENHGSMFRRNLREMDANQRASRQLKHTNQHKNAMENDGLCGMGDSQRDSHESIRANHSQLKPLFL